MISLIRVLMDHRNKISRLRRSPLLLITHMLSIGLLREENTSKLRNGTRFLKLTKKLSEVCKIHISLIRCKDHAQFLLLWKQRKDIQELPSITNASQMTTSITTNSLEMI